MSTRMALTVGFSLRRCSGAMGKSCLSAQWSSERLKDGEIADVLVGEVLLQVVQLLGLVALQRSLLVDVLADLPEDRLGGGAVLDVEVAEVEERNGLLLLLDGVVVAFQAAEPGLVLQEDLEVGDDLVLDLGLVLLAERLALVDPLEDLDDEHRMLGRRRRGRSR